MKRIMQVFIASAILLSFQLACAAEKINSSQFYDLTDKIFDSQYNIKLSDNDLFEPGKEEDIWFGIKLKQMTQKILQFLNVDNSPSEERVISSLLKSTVNTDSLISNDFDFKLSLNVGLDDHNNFKMDVIKLESFGLQIFTSTMYNYKNNELELGLSSAHINNYLLDGMKLEFQAKTDGSSAILLTTTF